MSALDRWLTVWDRLGGWWNTLEAAAGSERLRKQRDRYDSGRCMYTHPNGAWCFGRQTGGTPFCEDHIVEDDPDGWDDDDWDPDRGWGR